MAPTPSWSSRLFNSADTDRVQDSYPIKPCSVPGCEGKMHLREPMTVADAPHTLELPWQASWVCAHDSAHTELVPRDEYFSSLRQRLDGR